ncbi:hypothetical protein K503DRAFT_532479 [Rhizopogon vinicolor AM-OR11-026]|uniref:Uncharacterized protein n=1 Tax=Rhizopogon vinicolor AM-OR11-026 TaxID=1314800 RepID=A0A1B7N8M5_9AGAM|nr:hypothetical protein K503DRAFT_532479 [Rhizopogon vinicolor AM-OR11-026]
MVKFPWSSQRQWLHLSDSCVGSLLALVCRSHHFRLYCCAIYNRKGDMNWLLLGPVALKERIGFQTVAGKPGKFCLLIG